MGSAFARGLTVAGLGARLVLIDPALNPAQATAFRKKGARIATGANAIAGSKPEAIILAVKPQLMAAIAPAYADAAQTALVISIAAGTTMRGLNHWLNSPQALVRAMPNLPASIGKGMTAAFCTPTTKPSQKKLAAQLLKSVGDLVWLDDENLLNAVTAVSGSGPAYTFLLAESLSAAAQRMGLSLAISRTLARKTIEGAAALLAASQAQPADLRESVTSPGGTTESALKVLMAGSQFERLIGDAVEAATLRAFELAKIE